MNDLDSSQNLDPNAISAWLDNHPDFLHDYLKKLQIQRRRTSLLSDKSGLLLANFNTTCHKKYGTQDINFPEPFSSPNQNSSKLAKYSSQNSNPASLKSLPIFLNSTSLNPSFSEPNLPPIDLENQYEHENIKKQVSRNKFRQLSLYEKMYTLVKCLYQSLDLKTTCKKILNTVSLLLDADRCSLFLVVDEDDHETNQEEMNGKENGAKKVLVSVVFDAKSNSLNKFVKNYASDSMDDGCVDDDDGEQIKIPYGKGIIGYVASTGESVNIPDAYSDPRFNATIDQKTGYKTKSILCLPILNENGQCIAVAEAINKIGDESGLEENNNSEEFSFTKEDEEVIFLKILNQYFM